jgi:hypothetical protein
MLILIPPIAQKPACFADAFGHPQNRLAPLPEVFHSYHQTKRRLTRGWAQPPIKRHCYLDDVVNISYNIAAVKNTFYTFISTSTILWQSNQ